jgi:hypothetical protein
MGDHLLGIGNIGGCDPVYHFFGCIPQHPFGAEIEELNETALIGGDAAEIGAVENRDLQGAGSQHGLGASIVGFYGGRISDIVGTRHVSPGVQTVLVEDLTGASVDIEHWELLELAAAAAPGRSRVRRHYSMRRLSFANAN